MPEYATEGDLAARYADMKEVLQVPWMGVVTMAFAHYPNFFGELWRGLRPLCASRPFVEAVGELRGFCEENVLELKPPPIGERLAESGYGGREIGIFLDRGPVLRDGALLRAEKLVNNRRQTHYFLDIFQGHPAMLPYCRIANAELEEYVVSIPGLYDFLWPANDGEQDAGKLADFFLTADGTSGHLARMITDRRPLVFSTHWQSLWWRECEMLRVVRPLPISTARPGDWASVHLENQ